MKHIDIKHTGSVSPWYAFTVYQNWLKVIKALLTGLDDQGTHTITRGAYRVEPLKPRVNGDCRVSYGQEYEL